MTGLKFLHIFFFFISNKQPNKQNTDKTTTKNSREEKRKTQEREKTKVKTTTLSFDVEEEKEEPEKKVMKKNPFVETKFLADEEREKKEKEKREEYEREWKEKEERKKEEEIEITFSFWDGSGHRKSVKVKKGMKVREFLEKVKEKVKELRGVKVEDLMFVKEDLIIPQGITFYEMIENKARGKSGPLFEFDVHEDVRMESDARVEKDETHAGKVVERRWYERNKHIFPASRWEIFDFETERGDYTIHDSR